MGIPGPHGGTGNAPDCIHVRPDLVHCGLAPAIAHNFQRLRCITGIIERDRFGQLGLLLRQCFLDAVDLLGDFAVAGCHLVDSRKLPGKGGNGLSIGLQIGLFSGQQVAALAGLGVLGQRKQAGQQLLVFDRVARSSAIGALRLDHHCARADDQRQNDEADDERKRLPPHGAPQFTDHLSCRTKRNSRRFACGRWRRGSTQ